MSSRRTHIIIPEELVAEIDAFVGKRGRSQFLTVAARKELKRVRLLRAVDRACGAWSDQDHPELSQGADVWVEDLRRSESQQLKSKLSEHQ